MRHSSTQFLLCVLVTLGCDASAPDPINTDAGGFSDVDTPLDVFLVESDARLDIGISEDIGGPDTAVSPSFSSLFSAADFETMFPNRRDPACAGAVYTYANLVDAANTYPAFAQEGGPLIQRRELAAFLANIAHETTGGWADAPGGPEAWGLCFSEEVGCADGTCTAYCDVANAMYPCVIGETYHGRGAIQLSWNYNYGQCGEAIGEDLLADPSLVSSDGRLAFLTALWFWMTPQTPKPSSHDVMVGRWRPSAEDQSAGREPGFGMTINIINGGLECGRPTDHRVDDRVRFFAKFCEVLGTDGGENVECDTMASY